MAVNIVGGRYCPECGLRIVSNLVAFNNPRSLARGAIAPGAQPAS